MHFNEGATSKIFCGTSAGTLKEKNSISLIHMAVYVLSPLIHMAVYVLLQSTYPTRNTKAADSQGSAAFLFSAQ